MHFCGYFVNLFTANAIITMEFVSSIKNLISLRLLFQSMTRILSFLFQIILGSGGKSEGNSAEDEIVNSS